MMERLSELMRYQAKSIRENNCTTMSAEKSDEIADRLAYYEDMEEQGRLVVLPCKVGDTVYDIYLGEVKVKTVLSIALLVSESVNCVTVSAANERGAITQLENWRFGKTVFLTREGAEQALKGGAEI